MAEHHGIGLGERAPQPLEPPRSRPRVVHHPDPHTPGLHHPPLRQPAPQRRLVDVAVYRGQRGSEHAQLLEH
jgi:hypothetical protein